MITLVCTGCGKNFQRRESCYKANIARGRIKVYCSRICLGESQRVPIAEIECKNCGKIIDRLNKDVNRSKNHFCSISCSTVYNNKHRQHKLYTCACGTKFIRHNGSIKCNKCIETWKNRLLKREKSKVAKRDITGSARIIAKKHGLLKQCAVCSYSLHVDACHRRSINSFPDNTLIQEINNVKNLIGLCKNHHWEFDHGHLTI